MDFPGIVCDSLPSLVQHASSVNATATLESVESWFRSHSFDYAAVVSDGRVIGLAGRYHVAELLSGQYGFALHRRATIQQSMRPHAIIAPQITPLPELLHIALSRSGEEFDDDVLIVDERGVLIGLISTERLVQAQSRLVQQQMSALDCQHRALELANRELAASIQQQRALERRIIAREKTALIETLVGGIAHELNNKLMPIAGFAELLRADQNFEDDRRMIRDAAQDAARIVQQLLQLARPTHAQRLIADLREPVWKGLQLLQLRLRESNVLLESNLPEDIVLAAIDPLQIQQVVLNLVMNAIDAMEHRIEKRLSVSLTNCGTDARLEISDTGSGISDEHVARIFDPFFTTKGPNRGTGLGLSVSYSIIQLHDGDITVHSTVGVGTIFQIVLPLATDGHPAVPAPREALPPGLLPPLQARILVVEDDEAVARLITRALESQVTPNIIHARDGREAQRRLSSEDFDLVVSDVRMPHATGLDLFRWIQLQRPELTNRLIFTTGDASSSHLNASLQAAGMLVLRKPVPVAELVKQARAIVSRTTA